MRIARLGVIVAAILGIGALGYFLIRQGMQNRHSSEAARAEAVTQETERQECRKRLALIYGAWKRYRAEHKGAAPPTVAALLPKYIPDANLLLCPTAKRWMDRGKTMGKGTVTVGGREYPASYGFLWLTSGYARDRKRFGDKAPLAACQAHGEGMYQAAYDRPAPLGAFDEEQRGNWVSEVRDAPTLIVRTNGAIDTLALNER